MGEPEPPRRSGPSTESDQALPAGRSAFRQAVEAAARIEAQAVHAHRQAMALSLRAATAHDRAALVAGAAGLSTQATLHEDLASRARNAARVELTVGGLAPPPARPGR